MAAITAAPIIVMQADGNAGAGAPHIGPATAWTGH